MADNELFGISEQLDDISRAEAINAICEDGTQLERQGQYTMTMAERKQRDADILDALPSAKPVAKDINVPVKQPGWIPCSERLPDNNRQVLVYARSVHFALAKYDEMREADGTYKKQWVTFDAWKPFYKIKEVIAWMPIPEPWKGGQE